MTCAQEASCGKHSERGHQPKKNEGGSFNCEGYKSKIWDRAFSSPEAIELVDKTLESAKKMGTDEVCSDTIRSIFNFINVVGTNEHAFYSMRMLYKAIETIIRETNTSSPAFKETKKFVTKMVTHPDVREFILKTFNHTKNMVNNEVARRRLHNMFTTIKAVLNKSSLQRAAEDRTE